MDASLLILTDFFKAADKALDYATNLARPLGARLVLLHVRRDSLLDPELLTGELSNLNKQAINLAMSSIACHLPVPVVAEVGHGRLADAVADAIGRHHPTLVVLGRPDYSGRPDELIETTSLELLRAVPYPMLVVPHTVVNRSLPTRVLLAVDGGGFSLDEHAGAIRAMLAALHAELTVLHVVPDTGPDELPPLVLHSVLHSGLVIDLPPVRSHTIIHAHAAEGILEVAQPADYDLIILIARKRRFLSSLFHQSVTAKVLLASPISVLVLPAE
jgi:nucleotide-binding universal stress UspA family protein